MIAVTGATGTIGSELVRLLSEEGARVRALTRRPGDAPSRPGVTWVEADLARREGLAAAFEGAETLFLLTGNSDDMVRLQTRALEAARAAGVERVVKLSALGATDHSRSVIGLWHWIVEERLRASGLRWTILRPHHFMQNLLDPVTFDREAGTVRSASGDGAIPFIDTRDIAAVAARVLLEGAADEGEGTAHEVDGTVREVEGPAPEVADSDPEGPRASPGTHGTAEVGHHHDDAIHTLTGPEALSYREATAVLARVLDRRLTYRAESMDEAWVRRRAAGQPVWMAAAQLAIAGYQRAGGATARTTDTVARILGRPARTVEDFARDHREALGG